MVAYTAAPADLEMGLGEMGLTERTVVLVEKKSSMGRIWKLCGALMTVAMCVGATLFVAWQWNGRPGTSVLSGQPEALIEKDAGAETTDPHHTLRRISSKAKAAIHLEGSYEDSKTLLEWRNGQGQAFAQGGFKLVNNQIIIPQTGLYFVYSQASFRVSCNEGDEERKRHAPLSHRIWRYSDSVGNKASLMSAVRSACQNSAQEDSYQVGEGWYNAIYLGAVFQLHKGDKLWTETNQLAELETEEGKTFFGVFAL
ncbi:tumor necrosis factor b (TNF superfamily, member 2) [Genypterus blacodes]|uniref:tumor necrosis factor b (TNF superfamily, member 2) n=1 Tax=Genypterus blacodes TaxID=154954 RepID=UPI003F7639DF